ncbi:MAG TPA: PHB depolymerase family esterase [Opitutales bacterium]|nr:PHB depolymerase family esterase [Opitutales bacterium]
MAGLFALAGALPASDAAAPQYPGKAGTFPDEKIAVGNVTREYRLIVPASVDLSKPVPIVFAFHGMGIDNKDHFAQVSGLPALAEEHKFILVFPESTTQGIDGGQVVKGWALSPTHAAEDVQFFDTLLAKLQTQYRLDPDALYVTGMSNGAYFAHLITRLRANIIAAVAAHSGELGVFDVGQIAVARKFPVLIIHGLSDEIFPIDNARRAKLLYENTGHPVEYIEIPNWGHEWDPRVDEKIWDFFSAHRLHPTPSAQTAAPAKPATPTTPATPATTPAPVKSTASGTLPAH